MAEQPNVVGLELVVLEIDTALSYFVDVLGWPVAFRGEATDVAGEVVVLDGGNIAVTLLQPHESGPRMMGDRSPRLTQVVLGAPSEVVGSAIERSREAGVAVHRGPGGRSFIPPEVVEGILGFETALSFAVVSNDT